MRLLDKLLLTAFLSVSAAVSAEVTLPRLVSDRMVLQRDVPLTVWGWADPGECVTVRFRGDILETVTPESGRWEVSLKPQQPGGPFLLEVNEKKIRDVLVGDVWLLSGQSNQECPINRLVDKYPEIEVSNNHMVRMYKVPTQKTNTAAQDIAPGAEWVSATASDVMRWVGLAYFLADDLYKSSSVPVGMLVSSLGGSAIESWISQEHLKEFPQLVIDRAALDSLPAAAADKGAGKWNQPDYDDSAWKTVKLPSSWRENGIDVHGTVWYRKEFEVPDRMAGRQARLLLGTLVDSDSVFINGKFVGVTFYQYPPRDYIIKAGILKPGKNVISVKLTDANGNGEFVKDKTYAVIGDYDRIPLEGEWKYAVGRDLRDEAAMKGRLKNLDTAGSQLYNGMILPIKDYAVKGAVWYQGETNAGYPQTYHKFLNCLRDNWRELYGRPDMPFIMVQLPNFMAKQTDPNAYSGWALIREAQLQSAKEDPNTALAVIYDTGEWNDIHPLNKKDVAHRVAIASRELVDHQKIQGQGPIYEGMKTVGDKIVITFSNTGKGLVAKGGKLRHFAIAGADRKFHWADAVIKGNTVVVSSPEVKNPEAVRYAWSDNPDDANLWNRDGLLASPFRTDNW